MTRFWRDGFWRTSAYGNTHYVDGHWVERDDWSRVGSGESNSVYDPVDECRNYIVTYRADRSATARYVSPNAECPVCRQPVFFYQNEYGSRVYFDELGPPWPKHPCTDQSNFGEPKTSSSGEPIFPTLRNPDNACLIESLLCVAGMDMPKRFKEKYKSAQWSAWRIDGRFKSVASVLLVLGSVGAVKSRRLFISTLSLPRSACRDTLVFFHRDRLTYFNLEAMEALEVKARRIRTASAFVKELVSRKSEVDVRP